MSELKQAPVIKIPGPSRFIAYSQHEVLYGEYEGHPIVSVYDPVAKKGGAARIKQNNLDLDFVRWLEVTKREFGEANLSRLQIKFIVAQQFEIRIKELCAQHKVVPSAVAGVDDKALLDVFFFTDAGRLRIAPSALSVRDTTKESTGRKWRMNNKMRVMIVDDSKTMRALLRKVLEGHKELEVVAEAELPSQVEELIAKHQPDVMTMDINMPEMSGVDLLKKILAYRFIPTVMISSLNIDEGNEVLKALELGAVDYIHKPAADELAAMTPIIQEKILNAAKVRRAPLAEKLGRMAPGGNGPVIKAKMATRFVGNGLLAVGASTGGTEAIKQVFTSFPAEVPPILVVQHIPPYFSTAFANRLNELCKFEVKEAVDGDEVRPGRALIAPGGFHMEVVKRGGKLFVRVFDGDPVNRFKPSVDVLFNSVAKVVGSSAAGVILTGMGSDGAKGLKAMKDSGAFTLAQDEESCVVYGMPRAAVELGAASVIESLEDIPHTLMNIKAVAA